MTAWPVPQRGERERGQEEQQVLAEAGEEAAGTGEEGRAARARELAAPERQGQRREDRAAGGQGGVRIGDLAIEPESDRSQQ